jgi:uncharacterized protein (TIGR00369 family)
MATVLEAWLQEEAIQRERLAQGVGQGAIEWKNVVQLTGLEIIQGVQQGMLPFASIAKTLDFMLMSVEKGRVIFQGSPGINHMNPMGTIHGGWFASILDSALGCAIHTMLPAGRSYTTTELSVNLVRALTPAISRVRAEANVLHCGKQLATAEAKLVGPDGKLYAHATTTCLVFESTART